VWSRSTGEQIAVDSTRHTETVRALAVSSDGQYLISGSIDRKVIVWRLPNLEYVRTLEGHTLTVYGVEVIPDPGKGDLVVTASKDTTAIVWELTTGTQVQVLEGHDKAINGVAVSVSRIATASNNNVIVWFRSGLTTWINHLVLGQGENWNCASIYFGDIDNIHGESVVSGCDAKEIGAAVHRGGLIRAWDANTGKQLYELTGHGQSVRCVRVVNGAHQRPILLSGSDDQSLRVWDISTRAPLRMLQGHSGSVRSIAAQLDLATQQLIVATASFDHTIRLWTIGEVDAGTQLPEEAPPPAILRRPMPSMGFVEMESGTYVVALRDGVFTKVTVSPLVEHRYDTEEIIQLFEPEKRRYEVLCLTATCSCLFVGRDDGSLCAYAWPSCERLWEASHGTNNVWVNTCCIWMNVFVATGCWDHRVRLWTCATGELVAVGRHNGQVLCVSSVDDKYFVTGSADQTVKVWNHSHGSELECVAHLKDPERKTRGIVGVAGWTDPSGIHKVAGSSVNGITIIWDLATQAACHRITQSDHGLLSSLRYLPVRRRLAIGDEQGVVFIVDPSSPSSEGIISTLQWIGVYEQVDTSGSIRQMLEMPTGLICSHGGGGVSSITIN